MFLLAALFIDEIRCRSFAIVLGIICIFLGFINMVSNKGLAFFNYPLILNLKISKKLRIILCFTIVIIGIFLILLGAFLRIC